MRILIIQDQLRVGGTERQSLFLEQAFREAGHSASLLIFRPGGHLWEAAHESGASIELLQPFQSGFSFWAPGLLERVHRLRPDIILCMGRSANSYAGYLQRNFPERIVVGTIRTGKALFPFHQWSMQVVRGVLVNSNWWKRRFLESGYPPERVHVVHNALLLERSFEERAAARQELRRAEGVPPSTCIFVTVATFRPGKRHMELLQIVHGLEGLKQTDWRLWLVGDGREFNRCQRWVAECGLTDRVRFFHYQKDPFPYYAAADVAVSVSQEDSLPNFLIEAQSMGLPVIAYDCRGVEETCLNGETGWILPAGDTNGFREALIKLANDPAERERLGRPAPAFAQSRFSRKSQASSMLDFFHKLIDAGRNRSIRPCQASESAPNTGP